MIEKEAIGKLLVWLQRQNLNYTPNEVNDSMVEAWYAALSWLNPEDLRPICEHIIKHLRDFPKVPDILDIADLKLFGINKAELVDDAISDVEACLATYGRLNPEGAKKAMNPLAWEIVEHEGGWEHCCALDYRDLDFKKRDWRRFGETRIQSDAFMADMRKYAQEIKAKPKQLAPVTRDDVQKQIAAADTEHKVIKTEKVSAPLPKFEPKPSMKEYVDPPARFSSIRISRRFLAYLEKCRLEGREDELKRLETPPADLEYIKQRFRPRAGTMRRRR